MSGFRLNSRRLLTLLSYLMSLCFLFIRNTHNFLYYRYGRNCCVFSRKILNLRNEVYLVRRYDKIRCVYILVFRSIVVLMQ